MVQTVKIEDGTVHKFPDDATQQEMTAALSQSHPQIENSQNEKSGQYKEMINKFLSMTGGNRTNLDTLRDVTQGALTGLGKGGQFIASKLTGGYAPTVNMDEMFKSVGSPNKSITGEIEKGIGSYLPYGAAGGAGLIGQLLAGGAHGAATSEPGQASWGAIKGAGLNALTHGAFKGIEALRPSRLFRGKLSPEELMANTAAAGETSTGIGDVIGSPFLKRQYENVLSKVPFSGATAKLQEAGKQVEESGRNVLSSLLGKNNPNNVTDKINSALIKQSAIHEADKNALYNTANEKADAIKLKLELPKFSQKARDYSAAIEDTNMLKHEPDIQKIFNKLKNYKNPVEEIESKIVSAEGKPLVSSMKYPTLKEANLLKGKLNRYSQMAGKSPDPTQRGLAKVFGDLASSLKGDIEGSISESGDKALKSAYEIAEGNYKKTFSPFLDKDIYKFTHGNADPDTLVQSFIKTSKSADRSKMLSKLTNKLPEKERSLLAYSYFSRALDNEGNLNLGKLSTLTKNLGKKQFEALVPDSVMRKEILKHNDLYKMNNKAVNLMQNPATGQQNLDIIPSLLAHAGSGIAGGMMGGLPGAIAGLVTPGLASRPLVKWMTSPAGREALVKAMIQNKQMNKNILPAVQAGMQGMINR